MEEHAKKLRKHFAAMGGEFNHLSSIATVSNEHGCLRNVTAVSLRNKTVVFGEKECTMKFNRLIVDFGSGVVFDSKDFN